MCTLQCATWANFELLYKALALRGSFQRHIYWYIYMFVFLFMGGGLNETILWHLHYHIFSGAWCINYFKKINKKSIWFIKKKCCILVVFFLDFFCFKNLYFTAAVKNRERGVEWTRQSNMQMKCCLSVVFFLDFFVLKICILQQL